MFNVVPNNSVRDTSVSLQTADRPKNGYSVRQARNILTRMGLRDKDREITPPDSGIMEIGGLYFQQIAQRIKSAQVAESFFQKNWKAGNMAGAAYWAREAVDAFANLHEPEVEMVLVWAVTAFMCDIANEHRQSTEK